MSDMRLFCRDVSAKKPRRILRLLSEHPFEQKSRALTYQSSSVGARPSSAAPSNRTASNSTQATILQIVRLKSSRVLGDGGSIRRGRPRTAALRLKRVRVLGHVTSVRRVFAEWSKNSRWFLNRNITTRQTHIGHSIRIWWLIQFGDFCNHSRVQRL